MSSPMSAATLPSLISGLRFFDLLKWGDAGPEEAKGAP